MKTSKLLLGGLLFFTGLVVQAQDKKQLSLDEAINLAVTKSTESTLADTRVNTSKFEVDKAKNYAYPDLKVSGQYQRLTNANIDIKLPSSGEGEEGSGGTPKVNQLMLGQASASVPLFAGFKIKNGIEASKNLYTAETFNATHTKEELAMQAVALYVSLYKAQESVKLIQENLKSANQRVTDFTAMEKNGLLARNDLLKSQLQASNIEVTLEEAKKNVSTINYHLVTFLKLPEGTEVVPNGSYFKKQDVMIAANANEAISLRSDLEALRWQQKASESNVKIAKADYYPSVSLMGGYIALDVQNVMRVTNAVNFGVGVSYDISGIFKNGKNVKAAKSRAEETKQQVDLLTDKVKVEVQNALENYNLAIKQNKVFTEAVEQATENYRIVKDKYDNGLVDTNDLLEADVDQLKARINEAFSKADITQNYYELLNASGKLTNTINLTQTK
jgi:outer membrane protein TolC